MIKDIERKFYTSINETLKEKIKQRGLIFEQAEKIIIWIVGFCIGAFIILLPKDNFEIDYFKSITGIKKTIMLYLLYIVCSGLLFRIISFMTEVILDNISRSLTGYFQGRTILMDTKKTEIKNEYDSAQIIEIINNDFGYQLNNDSNYDSPQFRKLLKNIYEQAFDDTLFFEEFEQEYLLYFGFKNKTLINIYRKKNYIYLRGIIYRILYFLSVITFLTTIIIAILGISILIRELYF